MYLENVVVNTHEKSTGDNLFLHTRATIAHVVASVYIVALLVTHLWEVMVLRTSLFANTSTTRSFRGILMPRPS